MYNPPGAVNYKNVKGGLELSYDLGWHGDVTFISLEIDGRKKSEEFKKIETTLTTRLQRIDPDILISSAYFPNPMM